MCAMVVPIMGAAIGAARRDTSPCRAHARAAIGHLAESRQARPGDPKKKLAHTRWACRERGNERWRWVHRGLDTTRTALGPSCVEGDRSTLRGRTILGVPVANPCDAGAHAVILRDHRTPTAWYGVRCSSSSIQPASSVGSGDARPMRRTVDVKGRPWPRRSVRIPPTRLSVSEPRHESS
jgi:hypothetical protein